MAMPAIRVFFSNPFPSMAIKVNLGLPCHPYPSPRKSPGEGGEQTRSQRGSPGARAPPLLQNLNIYTYIYLSIYTTQLDQFVPLLTKSWLRTWGGGIIYHSI